MSDVKRETYDEVRRRILERQKDTGREPDTRAAEKLARESCERVSRKNRGER